MLQGQKHIAITGASSGIGAALAKHYAQEKHSLALSGRNIERLEAVAAKCREYGAQTTTSVVDVTNLLDVSRWVSGCNATQTLDIVHVNAGITSGAGADLELECGEDAAKVMGINLIGATNTINAAMAVMLAEGKGQIVITNSLASYVGFPGTPAYCASKAGLRVYAESLQRALRPKNITVTLIYPGYVESPMSRKVISAKPMTKSAEEAARLIAGAVSRKKRQFGFPYPLWLGVRLLSVLPYFAQDFFVPMFDLKMDMQRD